MREATPVERGLAHFDRAVELGRQRAELRYSQGRVQGRALESARGVVVTGLALAFGAAMPWWLALGLSALYVGVGLWMVHDCKTWVEEWKP